MKQNTNKKLFSLSIIGAASLLSGCAATVMSEKELKDRKEDITKSFDESYLKSSNSSTDTKNGNFGRSQKNWVETTPLPRVDKAPVLPEFFKSKITMTMPGQIMVSEVLSEMQRSVGIKFILTPDIYDTSGGLGTIIGAGGASSADKKAKPLMVFDFVYNGSLEQGLDLLCAKINTSWRWNGSAIEIYRYETKTYNIAALAGITSTKANVDLKGDTTGSAATSEASSGTSPTGGESNSSVSRDAKLTTWDEVKPYILAQLSPGGSMAVLESAGLVTVKDIPLVHERLAKSITDLNKNLKTQVFLNVDIYSLRKTDKDDVGIDLKSVNWTGSSKGTVAYEKLGAGPEASIAGNFNIGILKNVWGNPQFTVRALSSLGEASIVNQFSVTTLNGQPTPIASNRKVTYLQKVEIIPGTDGAEPTTSLNPGEVTEGINLNVTPKVEPSGEILLEYVMNLSAIEEIVPFTSNGQTIQMPTSNLKSVLQRAVLRSGETLVLSGFKQKNAGLTKSGVGSPSNLLMGGGHKADINDQYLVIMVTPYIANSNSNGRR